MVLMAAGAAAQVDDGWGFDDGSWLDQSDYDKFRRQGDSIFDAYRDSINARFARALAGKWEEFEIDAPVARPHSPEPKTPPVAPKPTEPRKPIDIELLPSAPVKPAPIPRIAPRQLPMPKPPQLSQTVMLPYYGTSISIDMPTQKDMATCRLEGVDEQSVSRFWQQLAKADFQSSAAPLMLAQKAMRLNDWGVYDMTMKLVRKFFAGNRDAQAVAAVFLMNQMEYDALVARTSAGLACLIAIGSQVYGVPYITTSNTKYYILMPDGTKIGDGRLSTYRVRFEKASLAMDLCLAKNPMLPRNVSSRKYKRSVAGNTVSITVNQNLMDFYASYPQLETAFYANADVDSAVAASLLSQFRPMVSGKGKREAVAALLKHIQYGFDYATDDVQFGYEKPFFVEENFYYPKNDCEDRAILLSWLVRRLVGLDVVLLHYPNHLSMAVCFPETVTGTYVMVDGKRYVECDPTYIGAAIGQTQPDYRGVRPEVIKVSR